MEQNKTGKYFKYAIGEILLVVIGILIALQINNWNEQRKTRQSEQEILNNLKPTEPTEPTRAAPTEPRVWFIYGRPKTQTEF